MVWFCISWSSISSLCFDQLFTVISCFPTMASTGESSVVVLNDDGICACCNSLVIDKEIIPCSNCKGRFHAICKTSPKKICSTSLLNNYMSTNTRDNFLWFCDPCLTKFQNDQGENESQRLHIIEKKYEDIEMKLEEIKSLCTKEPLVPSIVTSLPFTNPWAHSIKLWITKNGLNGD